VKTPNIRYINFDVPKDCKLQKYSEQLRDIIVNHTNYKEDFDNFIDQLFKDCFAFVKSELRTDKYPLICVEFVSSQVEYQLLERQSNQIATQKEKPKIATLGFALTTDSFGNKIYINFEPLMRLLEENSVAFVFNLVLTLVHEILHCFYRDSKNEQETLDLSHKMLEIFLGVTLPSEMKEPKADYYTAED
jgi:predicted Zn-dependent protease with MMP-like domain